MDKTGMRTKNYKIDPKCLKYFNNAKQLYENLKRTEEYLKIITKKTCENHPSLVKIAAGNFQRFRKPVVEIFKNSKLISTCAACSRGDTNPYGFGNSYCCAGNIYSQLVPYELLSFICLPRTKEYPVFKWPKVNWQYLYVKTVLPLKAQRCLCLFSGPSGCLLKEWRPLTCLMYKCGTLFRKMEEEKIYEKWSKYNLKRDNYLKRVYLFAKEIEKTPLRHLAGSLQQTYYFINCIARETPLGQILAENDSELFAELRQKINTEFGLPDIK